MGIQAWCCGECGSRLELESIDDAIIKRTRYCGCAATMAVGYGRYLSGHFTLWDFESSEREVKGTALLAR
jgi:hypothetical protein